MCLNQYGNLHENKKIQRGYGPGVLGGEKETNEDTSLRKDIGSADAGPTRPDSLTLDGGSGLKEVATWDAYAKGANAEGSTSSKDGGYNYIGIG